jgi:hypothetical protein
MIKWSECDGCGWLCLPLGRHGVNVKEIANEKGGLQ